MLIVLISFILQYRSFNEIFNYQTSRRRIKHYIKGRIPKIDAARKVLELLDKTKLRKIHEHIIKKIYTNKTMRGGTIGRYVVSAIDGVELFSSKKKSCKICLTRQHKEEPIEYFHRSVVCMTVGKDPHIIIGQEMLKPRDGNDKDEGELTGAQRLIKRLYKTHHHFADIIVADALYMKAPFINTVLSIGMDVVIRAKGENRLILKDALGLMEYEGEKESFTEKKIEVRAWDIDGFEMAGVKEKLRVLKFIEKHPKERESRIVMVLTSSNADYRIIWEIMHKRWDIEENGFHQLKTYYHAKHCFDHEALETVFMLNIIAFNLREMYLYCRIHGFRKSKMTRLEVSKIFDDDLLLNDYRNYWDTG